MFNLCRHNYSVPVDDNPMSSSVLSIGDIKALESMTERIDAHEKRFKNEKEVLLENLKSKHNESLEFLKSTFLDTLRSDIHELQLKNDAYYESIVEVSALICQTALHRLYVEIPNDQKLKSLLQEVVNEHRGNKCVELFLPEGFTHDTTELSLPEDWEISIDSNLGPSECRLKLDFGEVVGNFDESFKVLCELVGGQE